MVFDHRNGALNCRSRFLIVYFPTRLRNARKIGGGIDDEPGVNGNAVTTHAGPGRNTLTRGWRFAKSMTSHTFMPKRSQMRDSSLANAILVSRKAFSVSFTSSAVRAVVAMHAPRTNVL
jgi:hypothetical protein